MAIKNGNGSNYATSVLLSVKGTDFFQLSPLDATFGINNSRVIQERQIILRRNAVIDFRRATRDLHHRLDSGETGSALELDWLELDPGQSEDPKIVNACQDMWNFFGYRYYDARLNSGLALHHMMLFQRFSHANRKEDLLQDLQGLFIYAAYVARSLPVVVETTERLIEMLGNAPDQALRFKETVLDYLDHFSDELLPKRLEIMFRALFSVENNTFMSMDRVTCRELMSRIKA